MYRIVLSIAAGKDFDKVENRYKPHIFAALFDLRKSPYSGKKLKGKFQDCYSLRVGFYRIIYRVYKRELDILVIRIGNRQGIYK
jgi:addiction module RelE/StbE family toxin